MPEPEVPPGSGNMDTTSGDANTSREMKSGGAKSVSSAPGTKKPGCLEVNQAASGPAQTASHEKVCLDAAREQGEGVAMEDGTGPGSGGQKVVAEVLTSLAGLQVGCQVLVSSIASNQAVWTAEAVSEEWRAAGIQDSHIEIGLELVTVLNLSRVDLAFTLVRPLLVETESDLRLMLEDTSMLYVKVSERSAEALFALLQGDLAVMLAHSRTREEVGQLLRELGTEEIISLMDSPDELYAEVTRVGQALVESGFWEGGKQRLDDMDEAEDEQKAAGVTDDEDSDDPYVWASAHVDKAFECDIKVPMGAVPGFVLSKRRGTLKILYGDNRTVEVKAPLLGKYCRAEAGSAVLLCERTTVGRDGTVARTYSLVTGDRDAGYADERRMPRLRAYVKVYTMDAKGKRQGVAVVTATGTLLRFPVTDKINEKSLPVNSTFLFHPTFEASDLDLMVPTVKDIDDVEVVQSAGSRPMHLCSDLVQGFYAPDGTLQKFLHEKLGVNALPYVGAKGTALELSGGEEFIRRMAARDGKVNLDAEGPYACSLVGLGERMAKAKVYADNPSASVQQMLDTMLTDVVHLVIPSRSEINPYAEYLEQQLKEAEMKGYRLRVVVGVLIDECATVTSLYNTEDCVFFKNSKFPWVRTFNILDGDYLLNKFNSDLDDLAPAVDDTAGKKLLLGELDSGFRAEGALPAPGRLSVSGSDVVAPDSGSAMQASQGGHEVLVALPAVDPRVTALLTSCSQTASVYRKWGHTVVLAISFDSRAEVEAFVLDARERKSFFCMTKENLHNSNTLTLSCFREVAASELYTMLQAVEVLPVGGRRYRFTTTLSMLAVAKLLWKLDGPKRTENSKHYRVLRDDHNNYVLLGQKSPTRIQRYHRRLPLPPRGPGVASRQAVVTQYWYCVSNLPRQVAVHELRLSLLTWTHMPKALNWKVDSTSYRPKIWFSTAERVLLDPVVTGVFGSPVVVLPHAKPPAHARDLDQAGESKSVVDVLAAGAWDVPFTPTKAVEKMLDSLPKPAKDPVSVLRRSSKSARGQAGRSKPAKERRKLIQRSDSKAKERAEAKRRGSASSADAKPATKATARAVPSVAADERKQVGPSGGDKNKQSAGRRRRGDANKGPRAPKLINRSITDWTEKIHERNEKRPRVDANLRAVSASDEKNATTAVVQSRGASDGDPRSSGGGGVGTKPSKLSKKRTGRPTPYGPRQLPGNVRSSDFIAPQQIASHEQFVQSMQKQ